MRPYLELCRIYLVPTALADSFAGFALAGALYKETADPLTVLVVAAVSACLYSAGMASNDLFDLEKDRREAPHRPLPAGALSVAHAVFLSSALAALALGLGVLLGAVIWLAGAVLGCSLLYNLGVKNIPILGNLLMGSCRTGNFLIGATAVAAPAVEGSVIHVLQDDRLLVPALILGAFIAVVTAISRLEDQPHRPRLFNSLAFPLLGIPIALVAIKPDSLLNGLAGLVVLVFLFRAILRARRAQIPAPEPGSDGDGKAEGEATREPTHPATVYVRSALGGLILFDASLLLAFTPADTNLALPAAALYLLALFSWWCKRNWLQSGGADT
jgi:4-hydroxybenzoate polyprenyltransferase